MIVMSEKRLKLSDYTETNERRTVFKINIVDFIDDLIRERLEKVKNMSEKRFTIKPQDDYWAVVDNYNDDKVCIINGIHTEIEAIWLCDFMNEQQSTISSLQTELELTANTKLFSRKELERKVEEQQAEIERLQKIIDLTHYQLKVQDRIIQKMEENE